MSDANTERPSGAWVTPARANSYAWRFVITAPSNSTSPALGSTRPEHTRAIVVLPEPFEPSSVSTRPRSTAKLMPNSALNGP